MPDSICIIPSEALDADALASALLFAEIWQLLQREILQREVLQREVLQREVLQREMPQREGEETLAKLCKQYTGPLTCCLPLAPEYKTELLWRQDVVQLLEFIASVEANPQASPEASPLVTLEHIFGHCRLDFATELKPAAAYVLVDCHSLPEQFRSSYIAHKVIAVWDHRPDAGNFAQAPLRSVRKAGSCVALLLETALQLGIFEQLSLACCLFALATLHLDQNGTVLPREEPLRQKLHFRLTHQLQKSAAREGFLQEEVLAKLIAQALQKRNEPELGLFEQANSDVKFQHFSFKNRPFRVAVGTVPAPPSALQELCESGALESFMAKCCARQGGAHFFVLLHRQSTQNQHRSISFYFKDRELWNSQTIGYLLEEFQKGLPSVICYLSADLVQLRQLDSSISRKGFMPIFAQLLSELLNYSGT